MFRTGKYKVARWFFFRPVLPFAIQVAVLGPLMLIPSSDEAAGIYLFVAPWLLVLVGALNLPFFASAFNAFRMDAATRRNHALEHATIRLLEKSSSRRFSGLASRNGFQVAGATDKEIRAAFEGVCRLVQSGEELPYTSRRCSSNVVTALGLGLGLLLLTAFATILFRPPLLARVTALVAVVSVFVWLRHGIGNAIQRRFFTSVDFVDVRARDVRTARRDPLERGPVHFVETIVRTKSNGQDAASKHRQEGQIR